MAGIAVVVVDEQQPVVRYAVRRLLEGDAGVRSVVEAGTEEAAIRACLSGDPDLVVTDVALDGGRSGLSVCRFAKRRCRSAVLVHTADRSSSGMAAAVNAGADSVVHKSATCADLLDAIHRTARGRQVWLLDPGRGGPAWARLPAPTGAR